MILDENEWPDALQLGHGVLAGVFVGGCVARGEGSRFRAQAHAHSRGAHIGWICILSAKRLTDTRLLLHEVAHILTGEGHTDRWRAKLLEIGGTLDATKDQGEYHKRERVLKDKKRPHLGYRHHTLCPCQVAAGGGT